MVVSELKTKLNEKIECLESKLRNELATQLSTELTKLKNELILRIGYVDIHKKEAMNIFDFKVPDLVLNQKKSNFSPFFYCQGLRWYVMLQPAKRNDSTVDFIGCFIICDNKSDCTNWSVGASYELTLLAQSPGIQNRCFSSMVQRIFKRENQGAWGFQNFIRLAELIDPNNGFVKDQTIKIKVHLQADTIVRVTGV